MAALYYYTARSAEGSFVRGSIKAQSDAYALASLRTRALFVTSLEAAGTARGAAAWSLQILPVRHEALVAFFRSFATLVTAGVSIRRSLDVTIEESRDGRLAEALRSVLSDIESGLSLSAALERHPREFESLYVAMVRAGESGGVLDEVLERIALVMERDRTLRKRLASSLAYPAVVATAALGLVVFLLTSIVPTFASLYAEMQLTLPPMTAALLSISRATHEPGLWISVSLAVAGTSLLVLQARRSPYGRELMQRARLRMPIVGPIARKAAQARFARMLGSLLRSGVGLMDALGVTADAIGNAVYAASVDRLAQALREGETL
ncbi:MAG: type II secretion system F family protein, partial [Vulcanimicrobiaceae bacterium]